MYSSDRKYSYIAILNLTIATMKETKETKLNAELDKNPDQSSPAKTTQTTVEESSQESTGIPYTPPPPPVH